MPYASQTPTSVRYQMSQEANGLFSIMCLSFFFAYLAYKILMDYNLSQNRVEDRMKALEDQMKAIEENAQYINNEIVNNSESLKTLHDTIENLSEDVESFIMLNLKKLKQPSYHPGSYYDYLIEKRNIDLNEWEDKFKEWEGKKG